MTMIFLINFHLKEQLAICEIEGLNLLYLLLEKKAMLGILAKPFKP